MTTSAKIIPLSSKPQVMFADQELMASSFLRKFKKSIFPTVKEVHALLDRQSDLAEASTGHLAAFMRSGQDADAEKLLGLEKINEELKLGHLAVMTRSLANPLRDDIHRAVFAIDTAIDLTRNTVQEMQLLEITADEALIQMADILHEGAVLLRHGLTLVDDHRDEAVTSFDSLRKMKRGLEKVYRLAIADLFSAETGLRGTEAFEKVVGIFKRREIYRHVFHAGDHLTLAGGALRGIVEHGL